MELTEAEIADWVARHMATAPERDEAWGEEGVKMYLSPEDKAA